MNMANTSNIKTRIILRNDELSNWNTSELVLNQGEIALARREDGSYEMRIGNGSKTWTQLGPQNYMLSASQVIGLENAMSQLSTSHYEVGSLDELSNSYTNGDTAVVKKIIAGEGNSAKYSYTAYVYDGALSVWKAMDGNYSAENVYFEDDITLAGDYTEVGNIKLSDGTLPATGKSVKTLMDNIFTKELYPTASLPTASITLGSTSLTGEVGTTYTVPKATLKFTSVGSYTYGPDTGICCEVGKATLSCTDEGTSTTNANVLLELSSFELPAGTLNAKTFTDSGVTYHYKGTLKYTDGSVPQTNLGNECLSAQISSATITEATLTANCTATGKRKRFWYVGTDDTTAVDSAFLRTENNGHGSDYSTTLKTKDLTIPAGTKRVVFAQLGTGKTLKTVIDVDGMGLDIKDKFSSSTVAVEGANSYASTNYTVFTFVNSNGVNASTFKITLN